MTVLLQQLTWYRLAKVLWCSSGPHGNRVCTKSCPLCPLRAHRAYVMFTRTKVILDRKINGCVNNSVIIWTFGILNHCSCCRDWIFAVSWTSSFRFQHLYPSCSSQSTPPPPTPSPPAPPTPSSSPPEVLLRARQVACIWSHHSGIWGKEDHEPRGSLR